MSGHNNNTSQSAAKILNAAIDLFASDNFSAVSIKEIAYSTGFSHVSYFCAVIRRKTGMTPEEYRLNAGMD